MAVGAIGFGLFTIVFGVIGPDQAQHAFHNVVVATLLLVLSAPPVIAVARHPGNAARPLVILSVVGVAGLLTMAIALTPDPFTLPFVVLVAVLWALVPNREGALPSGRPSWPLLVVGLVAAIPLGAYGLDQAGLQRVDHTSAHAAFFHWVETAFVAVAIAMLALLVARRPAAYRMAAWCAGVAAALLGAGSVAFPSHASALPTPWGWVSLVGGLAFVALYEIVQARSPQRP